MSASVAAIFGSRSVEHEVSVITAQQVMAVLGTSHRVVPVYIAKSGRWYTGDALTELGRFSDVERLLEECTPVTPLLDPARRGLSLLPLPGGRRGLFGRHGADGVEADVAMPLLHGRFGEDGTVQGLLETAGVPYTGSGVAASALAMDKRLAKDAFRAAGLPVLDDVLIARGRWQADQAACLASLAPLGAGPFYVKPVTLGSSIGVSLADGEESLRAAIDTALVYDDRCLVERAQQGIVEINCAVLGDEDGCRPSALEQPITRGLLSYDDKYRSTSSGKAGSAGMKSAQRLVPAPLDDQLAGRLREAAVMAFRAIGAAGVARVDFLVDPATGRFLVNEINPIPGSLSFYLFEPDGLSFAALLEEMIALGLARHRRHAGSTLVFDHWMLDSRGPKSQG